MSDHDPAVVAAAMAAMEKYASTVPGYRRGHPRGHGFVGFLQAADAASKLTVAEHLQGSRISVMVRLSKPSRVGKLAGN
jgi:catalase